MKLKSKPICIYDAMINSHFTQISEYALAKKKLEGTLQISRFFITKSLTNRTLYGESIFAMTGTVTAAVAAQRKRVTGGIFRISSIKDISKGASTEYMIQVQDAI
jgi:hypothetical protein